MDAGAHITNPRQRKIRLAVFLANHRGNAGIRLGDIVIARQLGQRAALTEGRNRTHDDLGIQGLDRPVVEPQASDHAGRKVLDQHIDLFDELFEDRQALGVSGINTQALLAPILLNEVGAAAVSQIGQAA